MPSKYIIFSNYVSAICAISNRPGFPVPGTPVQGLAILSYPGPGPGQVTFFHPGPGPGQMLIYDPGPG